MSASFRFQNQPHGQCRLRQDCARGAIDQKFTHSQRRKAWPQKKNRHEPIWSNRHARDGKKRLWTLPLLLGAGLMASAVAEENAERSKEGFIEGSEVNLRCCATSTSTATSARANRARRAAATPRSGCRASWPTFPRLHPGARWASASTPSPSSACAWTAAAGVPAPAVASTCCPMTTRGGRRTTIREPAARSSCAGTAPCCGSATCSRKPR